MIDFGCKTFDIRQIAKCGLGLTRSEYRLLEYLMIHEGKGATTSRLAMDSGLDLTTVQKAVKKMNNKDLLIRRQDNLKGGGYEFVYDIAKRQHIREILKESVRHWSKEAEIAIDKW